MGLYTKICLWKTCLYRYSFPDAGAENLKIITFPMHFLLCNYIVIYVKKKQYHFSESFEPSIADTYNYIIIFLLKSNHSANFANFNLHILFILTYFSLLLCYLCRKKVMVRWTTLKIPELFTFFYKSFIFNPIVMVCVYICP